MSAVAGAIGQPDNDGMICQDFIEDNSLCGRPACDSSGFIGEVERAVRILSPFTPRIAILAYTPNTPVVEISGGDGVVLFHNVRHNGCGNSAASKALKCVHGEDTRTFCPSGTLSL